MKKSLTNAVALIIWLLPIIYLLVVYTSLPKIIALHYNGAGSPDKLGPKSKLIAIQFLFSALSAGMYLLIKNVNNIDSSQPAKYSNGTFEKVSLGVLMFMSILSIGMTLNNVNGSFNGDKLIFPAMGLLFAFLGNMMYSVKRNHSFGVRVSWTLNNEDNWRATHQFASKLWFVGGIILAILTLFLTTVIANIIFGGAIIILSVIPLVYSYMYHKKHPVN